MANERRVIEIVVRADDKDLKKITERLDKLDQSVSKSSRNIQKFGTAFNVFLGYLSTRQVAQAADEFQNLEDKFSIFVGSADKG